MNARQQAKHHISKTTSQQLYFALAAYVLVSFPMTSARRIWLTLGALVAVVLVTAQVSNVVRIKSLLVTIERKRSTLDSLQARARQERIAIARLESRQRICRIAKEQLGMVDPSQPPVPVRIRQQ